MTLHYPGKLVINTRRISNFITSEYYCTYNYAFIVVYLLGVCRRVDVFA